MSEPEQIREPLTWDQLVEAVDIKQLITPDGFNHAYIRELLEMIGGREADGRDDDPSGPLEVWSIQFGGEPQEEEAVFTEKEGQTVLNKGEFVRDALRIGLLESFEASIVGPGSNPDLEKDPRKDLKFPEEFNLYWERLNSAGKVLPSHITQMVGQLGETAHDPNELEAVVIIPAAAHQESDNIYQTLSQYGRQTIGFDKFEIILSINRPDLGYDSQNAPIDPDTQETISEVERFKLDHPGVRVRYFVATYRGSAPKIGTIRADAFDAVGLDLAERGIEKDVLLVSNDADTTSLSANYLEAMVDKFKNTDAEMISSGLFWDMAPLKDYPSASALVRGVTTLDLIRDNESGTPHTPDASTGISAASYFAIGGFDRQADLGEMLDLRLNLYGSRRGDVPGLRLIEKADSARMRTNSRRIIEALSRGAHPYDAWDQELIGFGSNDEVRTKKLDLDAAEEAASFSGAIMLWQQTERWLPNMDPKKRERILLELMARLDFA